MGIVTGVNFEQISMIELDNQINLRIAFFRYEFLPDYQMLMCLSFVEPLS